MTLNRKTLIPLMMVILILAGISSSALVVFAQDTGSGQDVAACDVADTDDVQHEAEGEEDDANEIDCGEDDAEEAESTACAVADTDDVQEEVDSETDADAIEEVDSENDVEDIDQVEAENEDDDVAEADCGEDDDLQEPAYTGSIVVGESTEYASEEDEATALASFATITSDEAQAIVETETGMTVVKVKLENENSFLVYSVELEDGSDVKVDAGDGTILHTEAAGADTNE